MAERRRLLVIARSLPEPAHDGYRIRVRNLISGLAQRHEVALLAYAEGPSEAAIAELSGEGISSYVVPLPQPPRGLPRLRSELSPKPRSVSLAARSQLAAAAGKLARRSAFDLVQLEASEFAALPLPPSTPLVIDEHNIWSELRARRARLAPNRLRSLAGHADAWRIKRAETRHWADAAGLVFTSQREAAIAARRVPSSRIAVVPNGVDIEHFDPQLVAADQQPDLLLFVGLLSYTPNVDAVLWFAREILPRVRAVRPAARLAVVGRDVAQPLVRADLPGLQVVGPVADVRPHLASSAVVVVPLRAGSGTRLKILEALAMGKAVVSTSIGWEGLDLVPGEHLLVADDPAAFARATLELLADPERRVTLGKRGRERIMAHYAWPPQVERLDAFHDEVLAAWRRV